MGRREYISVLKSEAVENWLLVESTVGTMNMHQDKPAVVTGAANITRRNSRLAPLLLRCQNPNDPERVLDMRLA